MKKNTFTSPALLLAIILFCSCSEIEFKKPQPVWISKNETMIPKNIRGTYVDENDTIQITEKRIADTKIKHNFDISLSDSVLLKIYNNTYFLNLFDPEKKNWTIIMAKLEKKYLMINMFSLKDTTILTRLKQITSVKEIKYTNEKISDCVINPTAQEFHKILDQNLFNAFDTLRKIY